MKNKYLKGAHISERKVRELLKLFCEDLTATQIAGASSVSRITVNAYLKMIRTHIARYAEERNPLTNGNEGNYWTTTVSMPGDSPGDTPRKPVYGIFREGDHIYTHELQHIPYHLLSDWVKGKSVPDEQMMREYQLERFSGIGDFNTMRLFRVTSSFFGVAGTRSHLDEIALFWGMLKARMVKFRGLNANTLYLHVKETEFRYNHRQEDIFQLLMDILQHRPLHYSRVEE